MVSSRIGSFDDCFSFFKFHFLWIGNLLPNNQNHVKKKVGECISSSIKGFVTSTHYAEVASLPPDPLFITTAVNILVDENMAGQKPDDS